MCLEQDNKLNSFLKDVNTTLSFKVCTNCYANIHYNIGKIKKGAQYASFLIFILMQPEKIPLKVLAIVQNTLHDTNIRYL